MIEEFVNLLPVILMPLVVGTCGLSVYRLTFVRNTDSSFAALLIPNYLCGYLIHLGRTAVLPLNVVNDVLGYIIEVLFAVVLGYCVGRMAKSAWLERVLMKLDITQGLRDNFWDNVVDISYGLGFEASLPDGRRIVGVVAEWNNRQHYPWIALRDYQIYRLDKNTGSWVVSQDSSIDDEHVRRYIVDTSKVENIVLTYDSRSSKVINP